MEKLVLTVLGMSVEAAVAVCAVLLLRFLFRRLPKSYSHVLWFLVLIRLLCPVAVSSSFSLMPGNGILRESGAERQQEYDSAALEAMAEKQWNQEGGTGAAADNGVQNSSGAGAKEALADGNIGPGIQPAASKTPVQRLESLKSRIAQRAAAFWKVCGIWVSLVWLAGAVWLSAAYLVQYMNWKEKVRGCVSVPVPRSAGGEDKPPLLWKTFPESAGLVESVRIQEPFVCGIFRPVICLPAGMPEKERSYILCHERAHIRHGDPLVRLLWQFALVVHWFNPFVWLAVALVQKDMEMFCDESVMKQCGSGGRKEYAMALLHFSMKKSGLPFPVAFGESNTESRIHHILTQKKPAVAAGALAVIVIALAAVFLLTDPKTPEDGGAAIQQEDEAQQSAAAEEGEDGLQQSNEAENGTEAGSETETLGAGTEASGQQSRDERILALARQWADAVTNRDGNALAEMLADPSVMEEYKLDDGSYAFGWSSPWPWFDDYRIAYAYDRDEVIIHYYANTSDPRIWPWREVLTLTQKDGTYLVDGWKSETDAVSSAEAFAERFCYEDVSEYGGDSGYGYRFLDTPLDMFYRADPEDKASGREETWAYWLIYHENEQYMMDAWQTPEAGAATHLYLDGGHAVEVESPWEDKICLRWEFADGLTDVICMRHPYAYMENGTVRRQSDFWVVENILEESAYEEELERARLQRYYENDPERLEDVTLEGWNGLVEAVQSGPEGGAVVKLSETPDGQVRLYGMVNCGATEGVLLAFDGKCQYFCWDYTSPRLVMPNLNRADYDGDGQEEVAVILLAYTGTGVSAEQLILLEKQEDGYFEAAEYSHAAFREQIDAEVACSYDEETKRLSLRDTVQNRLIGEMDLTVFMEETSVYEGTYFGDIVSFVPEDEEIYIQIMPGIRLQGWATLGYTGEDVLRARVVYDGKDFSLEDYELIKLSAG